MNRRIRLGREGEDAAVRLLENSGYLVIARNVRLPGGEIDVIARDLKTAAERAATSCVIIFVALDAPDGKPTAVPPWQPASDEDRRLADYAQRLIELSKTMEA